MILVIVFSLGLGLLWLLTDGNNLKYSKDYGPQPKPKKHSISASKVIFVRKRKVK